MLVITLCYPQWISIRNRHLNLSLDRDQPGHSDAEAEAAVPGEVLLAQLVLLHLEALLQDLLKEWMNVGDVG